MGPRACLSAAAPAHARTLSHAGALQLAVNASSNGLRIVLSAGSSEAVAGVDWENGLADDALRAAQLQSAAAEPWQFRAAAAVQGHSVSPPEHVRWCLGDEVPPTAESLSARVGLPRLAIRAHPTARGHVVQVAVSGLDMPALGARLLIHVWDANGTLSASEHCTEGSGERCTAVLEWQDAWGSGAVAEASAWIDNVQLRAASASCSLRRPARHQKVTVCQAMDCASDAETGLSVLHASVSLATDWRPGQSPDAALEVNEWDHRRVASSTVPVVLDRDLLAVEPILLVCSAAALGLRETGNSSSAALAPGFCQRTGNRWRATV